MAAKYKLTISDRVEFDVKFTLNDAGKEKPFGFRLSALRMPLDEQQAALKTEMTVGEFLADRDLVMKSWLGESPLKDEKGEAVPAGPEALEAMQTLVSGMVTFVHIGYLEANGAKGRAGN